MPPTVPARDAAPGVSVVMPAHNEAGLLDQTLKELVGELRERDLTFEVLVVENGSSDTTLADARAFAIADPVVRVLAATRDVVVVFDVDYYDADFVDRVLPALTTADGPAIVVGSKRAPGTTDTRPWPRRAITAGFASLLRYGFGLQVSDTHGMKAMRRVTVVPIVERCWSGTDLFDTELVLRADRAGLPVAEVPVTVEERRPSRTPILGRVLRTMVGLVRLRVQLWKEDRR